MKKTLDIKKLILLNMPYILMGLFATNFGEAWRMAQGADASEKFLSLVAVLPGALQSFWPSLHPLDLLVGLCCGVGLRLAVYLKSKNAKKYRHGLEYGSARWGTREDIAPYVDPVFQNNVISLSFFFIGIPCEINSRIATGSIAPLFFPTICFRFYDGQDFLHKLFQTTASKQRARGVESPCKTRLPSLPDNRTEIRANWIQR